MLDNPDVLKRLFAGTPVPVFDGTECWGPAIYDCLPVNPELEELTSDPALCQQAEARVCLVPVGHVRRDVVEAILAFHRETAEIEVVVLPSLPIQPTKVDIGRSQIASDTVYEQIQAAYGVTERTPSTFIGLLPIDTGPGDGRYPWWFGARYGRTLGLNHGVFSYFRMANVPPRGASAMTAELLRLRAAKYFGRYVALLHLDFAAGRDPQYLNYGEMWGLPDLDSMGTRWPPGEPPCGATVPTICLIPDNQFAHPDFESDLMEAVERVNRRLDIRVDIYFLAGTASFFPTKASWSEEFGNDLRAALPIQGASPGTVVIGVTDDPFAQSADTAPHVERIWFEENLAVVSGAGAGIPGTSEHRERLYRLLLRAIYQAYYGLPLTDDPGSIMYADVTRPEQLDKTTIPADPAP